MREAVIDRFTAVQEKQCFPGETWVVNGSAAGLHGFPCGATLYGDLFASGMVCLRRPSRTARVAVFNGVGTGYGDLICGSSALRAMHGVLSSAGYDPQITLVPMATRMQSYRDVFRNNPHVHEVSHTGFSRLDFGRFHFVCTSEGMLDDPLFDRSDLVDYFFDRFGIDAPRAAPELHPDPSVLADMRAAFADVPRRKTVLVNFFGSGVRRVPIRHWEPIVETLARSGWRVLLTAGPNERDGLSRWYRAMKHKAAFADAFSMADLVANSFDRLIALTSLVDAVVTVDTSLLHIAGSLGTPCVCLFYNIPAALRTRYYPSVLPYEIDSAKHSPWYGTSRIDTDQDPKALEENPVWQRSWKGLSPSLIRHRLETVCVSPA